MYWSQQAPQEQRWPQKLFVWLLCWQLATFHSMHTQFHTHIHTQAHMPSALQTHTVNGALSHQLVTYCDQMSCAVQISSVLRGAAQDFAIAFQVKSARSLVKSTEKKSTNVEARADASARHCASQGCGSLSRSVQLLAALTGCTTPNLSHRYQH